MKPWYQRAWCRFFHSRAAITLLSGGHYRCRRCGTEWPLPWVETLKSTKVRPIRPQPEQSEKASVK